jgi:hypothetical protein
MARAIHTLLTIMRVKVQMVAGHHSYPKRVQKGVVNRCAAWL